MPPEKLKALVFYTAISKDASKDDLDVLDEVEFVSKILKKRGYLVEQRLFQRDIEKDINEIKPSFIFNLVEAVDGKDSLCYMAPQAFKSFGVPYTGCTYSAFYKTRDKTGSKKILQKEGINTPYWLTLKNLRNSDISGKKFLIKSDINHASRDLEPVLFEDKESIRKKLISKGKEFFAEEYIDGREFNISIIGPLKKPKVLPPAEMIFTDWSSDKPKIVDYSAKWEESSHQFKNTNRTFNLSEKDKSLLEEIKSISEKCWNLFKLRGYARVDFRIDENNKPYVLEINANPGIAPDSGFIAACERAGMTHENIIRGIIRDSCGEKFLL